MALPSNPLDNRIDKEAARTLSPCPVCMNRVSAVRREADDEVWRDKSRPEHGEFSTPIWRGPPSWNDWITLSELMRAIETQTDGAFPVDRFSPPGRENATCPLSAKFLVQSDGSVHPLLPAWQGCCDDTQTAEESARSSISQTARQWSAVAHDHLRTTPANQPDRPTAGLTEKTSPIDLDQFIQRMRTRTLAVSAMAFQDAWTLDLDRIKDCCIHVADNRGRLIPFCLYNLTSISGKGRYRS